MKVFETNEEVETMNRTRRMAIALATAGVVAVGGIAAVPALAGDDDPGTVEQQWPGRHGQMMDRDGAGLGIMQRDQDRDCDHVQMMDRDEHREHMMDRDEHRERMMDRDEHREHMMDRDSG